MWFLKRWSEPHRRTLCCTTGSVSPLPLRFQPTHCGPYVFHGEGRRVARIPICCSWRKKKASAHPREITVHQYGCHNIAKLQSQMTNDASLFKKSLNSLKKIISCLLLFSFLCDFLFICSYISNYKLLMQHWRFSLQWFTLIRTNELDHKKARHTITTQWIFSRTIACPFPITE